MSELRQALDDILHLCAKSTTYTRRTQSIHEVAMRGLGMTASQREARHMEIMGRTGGKPAQEAYLERCAKRQAKYEERLARQETETAEAGGPP